MDNWPSFQRFELKMLLVVGTVIIEKIEETWPDKMAEDDQEKGVEERNTCGSVKIELAERDPERLHLHRLHVVVNGISFGDRCLGIDKILWRQS